MFESTPHFGCQYSSRKESKIRKSKSKKGYSRKKGQIKQAKEIMNRQRNT